MQKVAPGRARLGILLKADVGGSLEALMDVLGTYDRDEECAMDLIDVGVGVLTEQEIDMTKEFDGG